MLSLPSKIDVGERARAASVTQYLSQVRFMFLGLVTVLLSALFCLAVLVWSYSPGILEKFARERAQLSYQMHFGMRAGPIQPDPVQGNARSIPVLLYHGEGSGTDMSLETFVEQLRALKRAGWQTITMKQFEAFMSGSTTLPDKSFLLTFDDGRKDTYYAADPVLQDLGYTAVMFVITGFSMPDNGVKPTFYLNESELRNMVESGRWELESHGKEDHLTYRVQSTTDLALQARTEDGHFLSNKFWRSDANRFENDDEFAERIRSDLLASKQKLESTFGIRVTAFAYPFNDFGEDSINFPGSEQILAREVPIIYPFSFYQTWGADGDSFNYPDPSRQMVRRIEPSSWTGAQLLAVLNAGRAKDIPYQPETFGSDWLRTWGTVGHGPSLNLDASTSTTGAAAFLNGSGDWRDFRFDATFTMSTGTAVSLLARSRDNTDYFECSFSQNAIALEVHHATTTDILAQTTGPASAITRAGIEVAGDEATCLLDVASIISGAAPTVPYSGGIGIQIWNQTLNAAHAQISSVSVSPLPQ